jgi:dolichol-phosphate mannosyltransferase
MVGTIRQMYPDFKILIMDDNSDDGSKELVEALNDPMVRFFVREPEDRGLSASIFQGIMETDTEYFVNMDCDFQHPPSAVGDICQKLNDGADLCIGIREKRTALSPIRWLASWGAHFMAVLTLWLRNKRKSSDIMSGLFGGRTGIFEKVIEDNSHNFEIKGFKALYDLMKFAPENIVVEEVEFEFGTRQGGESKLSKVVILSVIKQSEPFGKAISEMTTRLNR